MKVIKNIVLFSVLISSTPVFAQLPDQSDGRLLYKKECVGGLTIHTAGWGFHFRYGMQITNLKKLSFGLDVVNIKHPKEKKVFNPAFDDGKGFYYGKCYIY